MVKPAWRYGEEQLPSSNEGKESSQNTKINHLLYKNQTVAAKIFSIENPTWMGVGVGFPQQEWAQYQDIFQDQADENPVALDSKPTAGTLWA